MGSTWQDAAKDKKEAEESGSCMLTLAEELLIFEPSSSIFPNPIKPQLSAKTSKIPKSEHLVH